MVEIARKHPIAQVTESTLRGTVIAFFEARPRLSHDRRMDTLFLTRFRNVPALSYEMDDGLVLRLDQRGKLVALEIRNFQRLFIKEHPDVELVWRQANGPITRLRRMFRENYWALVLSKLQRAALSMLESERLPQLNQEALPFTC